MRNETPGRILLVDGNEASRGATVRTLQAAGLDVIEARTGVECIELAATRAPELVLLDIRVPDIDGFELCHRLRQATETATIAIVQIIESLQSPDHRMREVNSGADAVVQAPIEPDVLIATVGAALRMRRAEEQLRQADRDNNEFLAMLAHELRGPLAPLHMSLHLLKTIASSEARVQSAIAIMDRQIAQMARMIDDLMDISRINRGKLALQSQTIRLGEVLASAVELSRPLIEKSSHRLKVTIADDDLSLHGDRRRLAQVFSNMLSNSAKYMAPGGEIKLSARCEYGDVVVTVADTGFGISPDILPRVFDMFPQGGRREERGGGLGLGLALSRALVELHGGSITAASAGIGLGSTFTVRLPRAHQPPAASAVAAGMTTDDKSAAVTTDRIVLAGDHEG